MEGYHNGETNTKRESLDKKLETVGWGLFFIWTGIAFLTHVGWGVGLLGVGIIILGGQAARKYLSLKRGGFWVGVGFFFVAGGIWKIFNIQIALLPILCIVAGVVLLGSRLIGSREINRAGRIGPCLK